MYGQPARVFDRRNTYFRPIEDEDLMTACSSSSPTSASSPVSFWSASCASQPGVSEDDLLASLHEEGLKDRERMKLIGELIVSERDYVKDLEAINALFLQPLRKRRILPETDVGQLFSTLPAIISLNKALLCAVVGSYTQAEAYNRSIDATVASLVQNKKAGGKGFSAIMTARGLISLSSVKRKECLIADAFQQMASYLKVYTTYSTRYVEAVAIIKRSKTANPAFVAFLEEVKGAPECRGRDMKTLMLRPVQRLCQYIAILGDLVRCTPRAHGDYHLLAQTAAHVQEVGRSAEESLLTFQLAAKEHDEDDYRTEAASARPAYGSRGSSGKGARWRGRVSVLSQPRKSFSVGDCGNNESGESLLSLLEREKSGSAGGGEKGFGGSGKNPRRSLKRGGSLTNTDTSKAQPRRVNSSASLCRCESATGATFKGGLVC